MTMVLLNKIIKQPVKMFQSLNIFSRTLFVYNKDGENKFEINAEKN